MRRLCRRLPSPFAAVAFCAALTLSSLAGAADGKGNFALKGAGAANCASFLQAKAKKGPELRVYQGWVEGYLTAFNQTSPETFDVAPWQSTALLLELLEQYCHGQPADLKFTMAVHRMAVALAPERLRSMAAFAQVESGGRRLTVYDEVIRRAQSALAARGYIPPAAANGSYGPATRAAVEKFQRDSKLAVNGLLDQLTLYTLLQAKPQASSAPAKPRG